MLGEERWPPIVVLGRWAIFESAAHGLLCGMADFTDPTTKEKAGCEPQ